MEPKWVYRLESTDPEHGLWYAEDGSWVWDLGAMPNCQTKDLPMGYDERYRKDGRHWFSSCSKLEDLAHWYSLEDALELISKGYRFSKYLATEYIEYPLETTFIKDTCIARQIISIESIWPPEKESENETNASKRSGSRKEN